MKRKALLVRTGGLNIYQVNEKIIPFSFGKNIFLNHDLHKGDELSEIILHEFIHVRQLHSIDIIWAEILCLLNWYNPFAWMLKRSIRQNLEFIADQKVLDNGIDRKKYQYLLLKVVGNNQYSIANQFNFSSLKKRIVMMNKIKSARVHMLRFLFLVPLLAVILLSFRDGLSLNSQSKSALPVTDTLPPRPPVAPTPPLAPSGPDAPLPPTAPKPPSAPEKLADDGC
jgi:hypothetical protein